MPQFEKNFRERTQDAWNAFAGIEAELRAIMDTDNEPEVDPETGSLLSVQDIEILESFDEGVSGYFGKMLRWLENQVIPLYEDELDYKLEHDVEALLERMEEISFVVNPTRPDAIARDV